MKFLLKYVSDLINSQKQVDEKYNKKNEFIGAALKTSIKSKINRIPDIENGYHECCVINVKSKQYQHP